MYEYTVLYWVIIQGVIKHKTTFCNINNKREIGLVIFSDYVVGSCWCPQKGADGAPRSDPHLRSAAPVHCQEPNRREGCHIHQSRQCHTGNQKPHECHIQSGHHMFCLRHQGE